MEFPILDISTDQIVLNQLQCYVTEALSPSVAQFAKFEVLPNVAQNLVYALRAYVQAEKLAEASKTFHFQWPKSRWQRYKKRHPRVSKRLPVKYFKASETVEVKSWATFPESQIVVPNLGQPIYFQQVTTKTRKHDEHS